MKKSSVQNSDLSWDFSAKLWVYDGPAAWHFLTLPKKVGEQIRFYRAKHSGFGTVRVKVSIDETCWETSLFPDKKSDSFLLPIKASIRKKLSIVVGDRIDLMLQLEQKP